MDVDIWHMAGNINLGAPFDRRKDQLSATQRTISTILANFTQRKDQSTDLSIPTHFVHRQKSTVLWKFFVSALIIILIADMAFRIWALVFVLPYGYHRRNIMTFAGIIAAKIFAIWLIYQFLWRPMYRSSSSALNRRLAISVGEAVINDKRPLVILLRVFASDSTRVKVGVLGKRRLEEVIAPDMDSVGPFIAVGQPKERVPHIGAARDYIPDDKWKLTVEKWVQLASFVVITASEIPGLVRKLTRKGQLHCAPKVILINRRFCLSNLRVLEQ